MVHTNDDAMNKIPLKSGAGLDVDEEKNGGEFIHDTAAAEEARREQMRVNLLKWMKKLTIVFICFVGIALISYVVISLCFSDWSKSHKNTSTKTPSSNYSLLSDDSNKINNNQNNNSSALNSTSQSIADNGDNLNVTKVASIGGFSDRRASTAATAARATETTHQTQTPPAATATPTTAAAVSTNGSTPIANATIVSGSNAAATTPIPQTEKPVLKASTLLQDVPITDSNFQSKLGVYEHAAVCSDREICSQIGSNILEKGGSAVDSAIATLLCNGIVTMHSMGIGGGMLMNVYIKSENRAYSIDAREVAPFSAQYDMFDHTDRSNVHGGLSIAVPGELMGYYQAHDRFGKLPWKTLIEPSIKLCNEGFYLSQHQWNSLQYKRQHLKNNTVLTNVFLNATTGEPHPVGTKLKPVKELCETYMLLAKNGPTDFYNGTLAELVAQDLEELGSPVNSYDLQSYTADLVNSITMQLGNDILYAVPPISSGTIVANILSILEGFNFTQADMENEEKEANTIHRFAEAMKFGFAKRWELGDARFNDVREIVSKLTNPEYNLDIRAQINDSTVLNEIYDYGAQFIGVDDAGTSHISILAPNGDAVSVTSSINDFFGCGQAGRRTGIIFNSGMADFSVPGRENMFSLPSSPSNYIDARKRAMSSMSPMILATQDAEVKLIIGSAGGSKIISAIVEVVARVLWFNENIKEAIDAPRFHHQLLPNVLQYQNGGFSEKLLKLLQAKGHHTQPYTDLGSVVCGIVRNTTAIYANADYRKQGGIAGY